MDGSPESMRGIASVVMDIFEDWMLLDKQTLKLLMELAGTIPSLSEVSRGLESLYLAEPTVDGYTTNQAAPAAESILLELGDSLQSYTELLSNSMRLQVHSLSLSTQVESIDQDAYVSGLDLPIMIDSIHMMMLKEYEVRSTIIGDLKVEIPPETLAIYITTLKAQPFVDETLIDQYRTKLALYDQTVRSRLKSSS